MRIRLLGSISLNNGSGCGCETVPKSSVNFQMPKNLFFSYVLIIKFKSVKIVRVCDPGAEKHPDPAHWFMVTKAKVTGNVGLWNNYFYPTIFVPKPYTSKIPKSKFTIRGIYYLYSFWKRRLSKSVIKGNRGTDRPPPLCSKVFLFTFVLCVSLANEMTSQTTHTCYRMFPLCYFISYGFQTCFKICVGICWTWCMAG